MNMERRLKICKQSKLSKKLVEGLEDSDSDNNDSTELYNVEILS